MLLSKNRGRYKDRDLFAVIDTLECGTYGYFRLAESNVAAYQPVCRMWRFHVLLDLLDCLELIRGLIVRERRFELCHPGVVL